MSRVTKIVFFGDVHSNLPALKKVAAAAEFRGADKIVCLGDVVGYAAQPNECVEFIASLAKKLGKKFACVQGNHDWATVTGDASWFNPLAARAIAWTRSRIKPRNLAFLAALPQKLEFRAEGKKFFVVHGSPRDALFEYVYPDDEALLRSLLRQARADVLAMGHTHVPFAREFHEKSSAKLVFNPGSVGQPRDFDARAAFALVDVTQRGRVRAEIKRVEYNAREAAREVLRAGLPPRFAERLFYGK